MPANASEHHAGLDRRRRALPVKAGYFRVCRAERLINQVDVVQKRAFQPMNAGDSEFADGLHVKHPPNEFTEYEIGRDVHDAVPMCARTPGVTIVAALTPALGIGATTAILSVVYGRPAAAVAVSRAGPHNCESSVTVNDPVADQNRVSRANSSYGRSDLYWYSRQ